MTDTRRWFWIGGLALLVAFVVLLHDPHPFSGGAAAGLHGRSAGGSSERAGLSRTLSVVAVFGLFTLVLMALLLVLVPMLAKQLFRLYELAPQIFDWLQHSALPWVQAKFGLADGKFWKFDKIKAAISEHMGQAGDIVSVVLSQATASSLALIGWLTNLVLIPVACLPVA